MHALALESLQLAGGRRFATESFLRARDHLRHVAGGRIDLSLQRPIGFRRYELSSAEIGDAKFTVVHVDSDAGYDITIAPDPDFVQLQFVVDGAAQFQAGETTEHAASSQLVVLQANEGCRKRWKGSTQLVMVGLRRRRLEQILADAIGHLPNDHLGFRSLQVLDHASVPALWNLVATVCGDLCKPSPIFTGTVAEFAERTISLLLIKTVPNSHQHFLDRTAESHRCQLNDASSRASTGPAWLWRLEALLQERVADRIGIDDLTAASGRSARAIYVAFRRHRDTSPLEYLKALRLNLARASLLRARVEGSCRITEVALDCGYSNLSQFSRDYRVRFGETPSRTLAG